MDNKINYKEIEEKTRSSSWLCYINNKFAVFLVYKFQSLPLTANIITLFSFLFVLVASFSLLIFDSKILFILFLITAYTFDNVDGIWARLKNQTSEFGRFFDLFLDKAKDYLVDLSFIIFYFNNISSYIADQKLILIAILLYFICKGLFYIVRDSSLFKPIPINSEKGKIGLLCYGGAEKFMIVYTLSSFSFSFFAVYIIGYLFLYSTGIFTGLHKMLLSLKRPI